MGAEDGQGHIGADPFALPEDERDPGRRLRGRLAGPVTVWTAYGAGGAPAGITVSSVVVAEGDHPELIGLVGPLSDFWDAAYQSKRFVVHVLRDSQKLVADRLALRVPGDPFEGISFSPSPHGPVLDGVSALAGCSLVGYLEAGYSLLVRGLIDHVGVTAGAAPLIHYRGRYTTLADRR